MNKRIFLLLAGIILTGGVLRFYNLATLPPSLEWDEVATGYDAYSILKTGRDQFGHFLPLTIRSLDDYKPPLYTYLTVGSIATFGWNDFAIRFPAALLGVLAILTTYGMAQTLLSNKKVALLSALLLSISPWHVNFSRLALETNSTIFFTTAAVWAFLAGLKNGKYFLLAAILFGLDLYLYHNARVFVPLLGLVLLVLYWRDIFANKAWVFISGVIFAIFVIRLIPIVVSIEGQMRFNGTSIFSAAAPIEFYDAKNMYARWRIEDATLGVGIYGKLFHNSFALYGLRIFHNYLTHFDPNFWLFTNDYPRHHVPEMGVVYFVELPFLISGWYFLVKRGNSKAFWLLLAWMLFAPVPAAVTRDVPHALRSEIFLPTFQISVAVAILGIYSLLNTHKGKQRLYFSLIVLAYFINVSFFLHKFLFHYAEDTSEYWQYGRKQAAEFADSIKQNYSRVIVSTKLEQPHVFFLYYLHYDPMTYLAEGGTASGGWAEDRNHFDKYFFKPISFSQMNDGRTLFVGLPQEFPPEAHIIKKISYLNGKDAIWLAD